MSCASAAGVGSAGRCLSARPAGNLLPVACGVYASCGVFFRLSDLRCVVTDASVVPAFEDAAAAVASMPPVRHTDYFGICLSGCLKCLYQCLFSVN